MSGDITSISGRRSSGKSLEQLRRADLAKIHIACQQLNMADDVRRDMLWAIARVRSSKDLDATGRQKVLKHLQQLGAVFKRKRVTAPKTKKQLSDKIIAMMLSLNYSDAYVDAMANKMFSVERWEWLEVEDMDKLMVSLAIHQRRKQK